MDLTETAKTLFQLATDLRKDTAQLEQGAFSALPLNQVGSTAERAYLRASEVAGALEHLASQMRFERWSEAREEVQS